MSLLIKQMDELKKTEIPKDFETSLLDLENTIDLAEADAKTMIKRIYKLQKQLDSWRRAAILCFILLLTLTVHLLTTGSLT
jgi:hypothetical protein